MQYKQKIAAIFKVLPALQSGKIMGRRKWKTALFCGLWFVPTFLSLLLSSRDKVLSVIPPAIFFSVLKNRAFVEKNNNVAFISMQPLKIVNLRILEPVVASNVW